MGVASARFDFEVEVFSSMRIERTVLSVAEIAGRHDAEGTDGRDASRRRAGIGAIATSRERA